MPEENAELTRRNLAKQTFLRRQGLFEHLKEETVTDELTGLYNRRGFNRKFEEYYKIAQRTGDVLRIIFVDADKFKEINDNFSYDVGDLVLKTIATGMQKTFQRDTDIKIRWGGDEFAILSLDKPGDTFLNINNLSDRLNNAITHSRSGEIPKEVSISVTLGMETWNREDSIDELKKIVEDHMKSRKNG